MYFSCFFFSCLSFFFFFRLSFCLSLCVPLFLLLSLMPIKLSLIDRSTTQAITRSINQPVSQSPHLSAHPDTTIYPPMAPSGAATHNTSPFRDPGRHWMVGGTRDHTGARGLKPSCAQRRGQSDSTWARSCPFSEAFCATRLGKKRRWVDVSSTIDNWGYISEWPAIKTPPGDLGI